MSPAEKLAAKKPLKITGVLAAREVVLTCRIRQMRDKLGLSIRDIQKATGVHNAVVSYAERGYGIGLSNALRLAKFFGVAVEELWEERK